MDNTFLFELIMFFSYKNMDKKLSVWLIIGAILTLGISILCARYNKRKTNGSDDCEVGKKQNIETNTTNYHLSETQRIELREKAKKRNKRFEDFETFYNQAKDIFEPYRLKGEREKYYQNLYMLCVCPGSRAGGCESRIVEFFWGKRIFDKDESLSADGRRSLHFLAETGATMLFFKNDDGYVSIQMFPAHTDQRHSTEDFIFFEKRVNPSRLLQKSFQISCWSAFMAYMEVTSLDGDPTLWQKLKVWYYRNFKYVIIDNKELPLRYVSFLQKVGTWVLTIGCSGLVIFLLQLCFSKNSFEHRNIKDIRDTVIETNHHIIKIQDEVNRIKLNQDSIINISNRTKKKNVENTKPNK